MTELHSSRQDRSAELGELRIPRLDARSETMCEEMLEHPLVQKARSCALAEFEGHFRKGVDRTSSSIPYFAHLEAVALVLIPYGFRPEVIAAAYLHDHLEDLPASWTEPRLALLFGTEVSDLVNWVTELDKGRSWEERNFAYAKRLATAPDEARALSLADKLCNTRDLIDVMRAGIAIERVVKRGFQANSEKLHRLKAIYQGHVPQVMLTEFCETLEEFDRLGAAS